LQLVANSYPKNLLWILIAATIPGAIAGVLLEKQAETVFRNPLLVAINLVVFGIIIWAVDRYAKKSYKLSHIRLKPAILIGLAQMLAIVPGVSRSGSTMAAGRAIGLSRPDSARFSFLLAAPIMLGTALYEFRHVTRQMADLGFFIGILASMIFGFIAIKYLLKYLQKGNYAIFTWYRIIIAVIVVIVYVLR
jgi:undecaprenyl-diphosphatase